MEGPQSQMAMDTWTTITSVTIRTSHAIGSEAGRLAREEELPGCDDFPG
jgi:hypothetical protein